jgi:DNA-directed RNA polymerase subunit RPC12/RpoP
MMTQTQLKEFWYKVPTDNNQTMKCDDCGHKSKEWAECDNYLEYKGTPLSELNEKTLKELNHEDICNQVRCPNCKSWFYF